MREEILRMEHILCENEEDRELNYVSMQIFRGEIYGVLCLEQHGLDKLVELICWNRPIQSGQVFFLEKMVNSVEESFGTRNQVTVIGRQSRLIDELSLADNLFVIREGFKKNIIPERVILAEARRMLQEWQIDLSPRMLVKQMGTYHRMVTELMKAVVAGDALIVLWEISDLLSTEELPRFHQLIRRLADEGHTFLYIYSHHEVLRMVCDRLAIFKEGMVQKVFTDRNTIREQITKVYARHPYEKYLQIGQERDGKIEGPAVLSIQNLSWGHIREMSLKIRKGESVLLLDKSNTILEEFVEILTGEERPFKGELFLKNGKIGDRKHIALIQQNAIKTILFPEMSFLENLCFPLGEKNPGFWQHKQLKKSVLKEYREEIGNVIEASDLYGLPRKELYTLIYYRYLIAKPDLIVCMKPLSDMDMYLRIHVMELLAKLRSSGIAVLILSTELYDTLYIADRLIQVENGRIVGEYAKENFEEVRMMQREFFPD